MSDKTKKKTKKNLVSDNWIRIGDDYINKSCIEAIDYRGRWIRTSRVYLVPINQRAKVLRLLSGLSKPKA